jgi:acetoacetate decarboxylase
MIPAHFGSPFLTAGSGLYKDVTTINITYLTDREKLSRYLPEGFAPAQEALITVSYSLNREIEWLAGRSYSIVAVTAGAIFQGQVDYVAGDYCLVLWENLTDPILTGRELQGIPKIYADIEDYTITDGIWQTSASHWDHKIVDMAVKDLQPLSPEGLTQLRKSLQKVNWMGWKYIPKTGTTGADVSYATLFPVSATVEEAWAGTGEIRWNRLTWKQNPTQYHIVNALSTLPILEYRFSAITKGTTNLRVPNDPVRPLR